MPYIPKSDRWKVDDKVKALADCIESDGDYNYVISKLFLLLAQKRGVSYAAYNALIGVLECAKLEAYRRHVAPYEDTKIQQNGDVDES